MITEEKKRREAFKFNADLSDQEIRSIRASESFKRREL